MAYFIFKLHCGQCTNYCLSVLDFPTAFCKKPEKKSIAVVLAGVAVISIILNVMSLSDFYRMILETVLIAVCARCFQETDIRMSLFVGIFYEIAVTFWQFLLQRGSASYSIPRPFLTIKQGMGKLRSGVSICC